MACMVGSDSHEKGMNLRGHVAFEACERFLLEIEAMREIFGDGEFHINLNSFNLLKSLVKSCENQPGLFDWSSEGIPESIACTVVTTTASATSSTIEIHFTVPQGYLLPGGPKVFLQSIQCAILGETARNSITLDINNLLLHQWEDECIYNIVQSVTDRCSEIVEANTRVEMQAEAVAAQTQLLFDREARQAALTADVPVLGRRIIFSHHIIADSKRSAVRHVARDLGLGGISKIGWPGLILVEGEESACKLYVQAMQRLRWKQLTVRGEQQVKGDSGSTIDSMRLLEKAFVEFGTDEMSAFAEHCRNKGLESLFLAGLQLDPEKHSRANKKKGPRSS